MKKLRTATTAIIILFVLISTAIVIYYIPFGTVIGNIPFVKQFYNNTKITINSKNGKAEVYIGDKSYGETPTTISDLDPNQYKVTLRRVSGTTGAYEDRFIDINLEKNTEAIIDLEIGPKDVASGYVMYYTQSPQSNSDKGYISITSTPDNSAVYLDSEYLNKTAINAQVLTPKEYEIKVSKDGYESITFPAIVRGGYNININTYLLPIPLKVTEENEQ